LTHGACSFCFFFNDTATTEIYTLSLHDALPILDHRTFCAYNTHTHIFSLPRSEEHTSELQSHLNLVCRLLLEKNIYDATRRFYSDSLCVGVCVAALALAL